MMNRLKLIARLFRSLSRRRPHQIVSATISSKTVIIFLILFLTQNSAHGLQQKSSLISEENPLTVDYSESQSVPNHSHSHGHDEDNRDDDDEQGQGLFSSEGHRGHSHEDRCIERTVHEPKNFYYGEQAIPINILTSDRLSHKLVSNILQVSVNLIKKFPKASSNS